MSDIQTREFVGNGTVSDTGVVPEPTVQHFEDPGFFQGAIPIPIPIPMPLPFRSGSRFYIWKQDPSVRALGRRLTYIPNLVLNGPRDARINTQLPGTTPVTRSWTGDFLYGGSTAEGDCAHAFAVVRQTLSMYERLRNGAKIPWAWNTSGNTQVINVFPRAGVTPNAFYSRGQKALKFYYFTPSGSSTPVYTCRSFDIVAHEAGHAILDGLKPGWLGGGNPPQTGGLHESFGDLSALFLALSQLDQVEAFVALTRGNLHAKNFLAAMAEQFGVGLGRPMGLRNSDNNLKLSQVGNQVHSLSQVFTGGIYDVLADIFAFEKYRQRASKGPAQVLYEVSQHLCKLLLEAIIQSPSSGATYSHVVNKMLSISAAQGDPAVHRYFIRRQFSFREVVVSPTPLTAAAASMIPEDQNFTDGTDVTELEVALPEHASCLTNVGQDRSGTCGTMQLPEYAPQTQKKLDDDLRRLGGENGEMLSEDELLVEETEELMKAFK